MSWAGEVKYLIRQSVKRALDKVSGKSLIDYDIQIQKSKTQQEGNPKTYVMKIIRMLEGLSPNAN